MDEAIEAFHHSSDEPENQHGFVYAHNLNTYKLSKKERIEEQNKEGDDGERKGYQRKRDKKKLSKAGKTNIEQRKNKPMSMVLPKKVKAIKLARDKAARKVPIKKGGLQLGHFRKHTKQRLEAKKRRKTN